MRGQAPDRRNVQASAKHADHPRLSWPQRRWEPGDGVGGPAPDVVRVEEPACGRDARETGRKGARSRAQQGASDARLVQGDALDVARALADEGLAGKVDLVYVDPPFGSQAAYVHEARLDGPADGRVVRTQAYDDRWGESLGSYVAMLAPRLDALVHLLSPAGTIWVHVDWRASYLARMLLDEILGPEAFVNEIVWRRAPNLGRQAASHQFGRTLDTLVVYGKPDAKLVPPTRLEPIEPGALRMDDAGRPFTTAPRGDYTDASIARLEKEGRVHRTASGRVYIKYFLVKDGEGQWCRERRVDALWTDVAPLRHARPSERTGFPTQKPRALLDRVVACASPPGGLVVDVFAGSGTTGESAHALGRRFVLGDAAPMALATARARLLRAGVPLVVEACGRPADSGLPAPGSPQEGAAGERAPDRAAPRVKVEQDGEHAVVRLEAPQEPLAWAVDSAFDVGQPFRVAWHSERAPGKTPVPAARQATIAKSRGPLAVRVWYDDGRVATKVLGVP